MNTLAQDLISTLDKFYLLKRESIITNSSTSVYFRDNDSIKAIEDAFDFVMNFKGLKWRFKDLFLIVPIIDCSPLEYSYNYEFTEADRELFKEYDSILYNWDEILKDEERFKNEILPIGDDFYKLVDRVEYFLKDVFEEGDPDSVNLDYLHSAIPKWWLNEELNSQLTKEEKEAFAKLIDHLLNIKSNLINDDNYYAFFNG